MFKDFIGIKENKIETIILGFMFLSWLDCQWNTPQQNSNLGPFSTGVPLHIRRT